MTTAVAAKTLTNFDLFDVAHAYLTREEGPEVRVSIVAINSKPLVINRLLAGFSMWSATGVVFRKGSAYHRYLAIVGGSDGHMSVFSFITDGGRDAFISDYV